MGKECLIYIWQGIGCREEVFDLEWVLVMGRNCSICIGLSVGYGEGMINCIGPQGVSYWEGKMNLYWARCCL